MDTPGKTVNGSDTVPVPPRLSFTVRFTVNGLPVEVLGDPEITPAVERVKFEGRPVALHV
jgi:hypothetical protein